MQRRVFALLVALAGACGHEKDDRPLELEYLTSAIFAPTCGATQCHSSFKQANGLVLDTPEHVRASLLDFQLIRFDTAQYDPDEPDEAALITWISELDPFEAGIGRMPFDAPIPDKDKELLIKWIEDPALRPSDPGGLAFGAQCNPANAGEACRFKDVVRCGDDWNFGEVLHACRLGCGGLPGPGQSTEERWCTSVCGDGDVDGRETCDDGNTQPGDGCSASCTVEP